MLLPVERAWDFFLRLELPAPLDEATDLLLGEIRGRFPLPRGRGSGLPGHLDRQSRTLSGGEVQRINLTTALGTSLVNTLFVLDEPSIGLHPRDMQRVIGVMKRLRSAGNLAAGGGARSADHAGSGPHPRPGTGRRRERGGSVVFFGSPAEIRTSGSVTGEYLTGRRSVAPEAPEPAPRRPAAGEVVAEARPNRWLELKGATEHNLRRTSTCAFP